MTQYSNPDFAVNRIAYDQDSKDFVRISNGTCTLDHSSPGAFATSHNGGPCIYAASEAVALRCVGIDGKGNPIVAITYRKVDQTKLRPAKDSDFPDVSKVRRSLFIGRV